MIHRYEETNSHQGKSATGRPLSATTEAIEKSYQKVAKVHPVLVNQKELGYPLILRAEFKKNPGENHSNESPQLTRQKFTLPIIGAGNF